MLAARVLLICHQNFIAGLQVDAIGDIAIGLCRVAQESDFVAITAHKCGERITELVPGGVSSDWIVLGIGFVQFLAGLVALKYGSQHGGGARSDSAVIQVNFVRRDQELFAEFSPIGVFVRVEKRALWEVGGQGLELSPEVAAPCQGRSDGQRRGK